MLVDTDGLESVTNDTLKIIHHLSVMPGDLSQSVCCMEIIRGIEIYTPPPSNPQAINGLIS